MFLLFCTDAMGTKKVYPWLFDFTLLYGCCFMHVFKFKLNRKCNVACLNQHPYSKLKSITLTPHMQGVDGHMSLYVRASSSKIP